jgi:hypothetical protein
LGKTEKKSSKQLEHYMRHFLEKVKVALFMAFFIGR